MGGKVKFALVKVVSQRLLLCLCGLATAAAAPLHGRPAKTSSCEAAVPIPGEAKPKPVPSAVARAPSACVPLATRSARHPRRRSRGGAALAHGRRRGVPRQGSRGGLLAQGRRPRRRRSPTAAERDGWGGVPAAPGSGVGGRRSPRPRRTPRGPAAAARSPRPHRPPLRSAERHGRARRRRPAPRAAAARRAAAIALPHRCWALPLAPRRRARRAGRPPLAPPRRPAASPATQAGSADAQDAARRCRAGRPRRRTSRPDAGVPSGVVPKERGHPPTLPPLA